MADAKLDEFTPAKEEPAVEPTEPSQATEPERSPAQQAFLDETRQLFEKLDAKPEPEKVETEKTKAEPEAKPKEETGFIKDFSKATPEDFKKRIDYLYAQKKDHERQWAEAREYMQKTRLEMEELRKQSAKEQIARTESELDAIQIRVVDLLDRNSPNYNPQEGARLLRELTNRDVEARNLKEQEKEREKTFQESLKAEETQRTTLEAKAVLDEWASTRDYAQPGHPMYPQVVTWLKTAYEKAPKEVTVEQIVRRCEQIFDAHVKTQEKPPEKPAQEPSRAAGANGEKLTVSAVIGSKPAPSKPVAVGDKLSAQQRMVAERLFYSPEKGITKAKAYEMYAQGL